MNQNQSPEMGQQTEAVTPSPDASSPEKSRWKKIVLLPVRMFRSLQMVFLAIGVFLLLLTSLSWIGIDLITPLNNIVNNLSADQRNIEIVKNGRLEAYPEHTVGEAFDNFFGSPHWTAFESDTGEQIVEFTGDCTYLGEQVKARIQFIVRPEENQFRLHTIGFNDVPQNQLVQMALLDKVFEEAETNKEIDGMAATSPKQEAIDEPEPASPNSVAPSATKLPEPAPPSPTVSQVILADAATLDPLPGLIEWKPGQEDVILPLDFDGEQAELRLGLGHPNGIMCRVVLKEPSIGWELDISQADTSFDVPYDETGELREGFVMQAASHDFDDDGTPEIVVAAGDGMVESYAWVFSYNKGADPNKINPFVQELRVTGQTRILVESNKLLVPYGSQGLFEEYAYVDKQFYKREE